MTMTNEVISAIGISIAVFTYGVYYFTRRLPFKKAIKVIGIVLLSLVVVAMILGIAYLVLGELQ